MQKQEAQNIIESTFNASFSEEKFTLFIKNLLNDIDTTKYNEYRGNLIKDAYKDHIRQYKRIGKYTDPNGDALDVLIVEVKDQTKLDKTRTALRNFVISHLDSFEKDYALVAFYSNSDHGADWRFSFVKLEYKTEVKEGKLKQSKELTPAKRYSFLVGVHEKAHTAKKQLLPLLENVYNNPTLEELEEAFSIEKVTDEFFEQYKSLFLGLTEQFNKDRNGLKEQLAAAGIDIPRFTKKLLGQIVFLYFLQKKGWLGVPKTEKWGKGEKKYLQKLYDEAQENGKNFFGDYLQPLFYKALAHKHADEGIKGYYKTLGCKVPFLNGGLFEADYKWEESHITIPNHLFRNQDKVNKTGDVGTGVLDVFDRYNFTIKEDEPLEKEVAVDPEMLGKVFENMLEVTERKSKGAFYTPREIVHYMCQESLIHYLDNAVNTYAKTYRELGNAQTNLFGNAGKKGQQTLMQEQEQIIVPKDDIEVFIRKGFFALENDLRVLKEGKETRTYTYKLPESIRLKADLLDEKLADIKICDPAIGSGAFPVGMLHEIVNARLVLRQYLKNKKNNHENQVNPINRGSDNYAYQLKSHTIQESIYGVDIDASAIDIARLRLWLSLVVDEEDLDNIEALPNLDYKIVCGNSLIGFPENWKSPAFSKLEELKNEFFTETDSNKKKEIKKEIDQQLKERLEGSEKVFGYKVDFDFKLFFSEVWHEKSGFDVVIGNPPYDVYEGTRKEEIPTIKNIPLYDKAKTGKFNAYKLFLAKASSITKSNGNTTLIFQNSFLADNSAKKLREFYLNEQTILKIDSFPERDDVQKRVFKSAKMSVCIMSVRNQRQSQYDFLFKVWHERQMENSYEITFKNNEILNFDIKTFAIPSISVPELPVLKKLSTLDRFGDYSNCFQGEVNLSTCKEIITEHPSSNTKPLLKGAGIQRWFFPLKMSQGKEEYLFHKEFLKNNNGPRAKHHKDSRIVMQGITGVDEKIRLKSNILVPGVFCGHSVNYLIFNNPVQNEEIRFYLSLLNSSCLNWFFKKFSTNSNVNSYEVNNLPVVKYKSGYHSISILIEYLLFCYNPQKINSKIISLYFDNIADSIAFELYFPTEIKSAGKEILKHLGDLKPISDSMSDEEKLAIIQSEFERLYDPNHPVRNNIETLDSVEEVRIIKEALK